MDAAPLDGCMTPLVPLGPANGSPKFETSAGGDWRAIARQSHAGDGDDSFTDWGRKSTPKPNSCWRLGNVPGLVAQLSAYRWMDKIGWEI
jgi:hypothetical protein